MSLENRIKALEEKVETMDMLTQSLKSELKKAIEDIEEEGGFDETKSYNIIPFIMERYKKADDYREQDEQRWLRAYRNYRGLYGSDVQFTEAEKSRVFIKVTKTKTLAAYGQIVDVLFASNKFPLTVEPTVLPEGVVGDVKFILC